MGKDTVDSPTSQPSIIQPLNAPSIRTSVQAKQRISNFMGHALSLLNHLKQQNKLAGLTADKAQAVYDKAMLKITPLQSELERSVETANQVDLNYDDIENLKKNLKKAEEKIAKVIRQTQLDVASEIGKSFGGVKTDKVESLARGGWSAKWIYFLAFLPLVAKTNQTAILVFKLMEAASKTEFLPASDESKIESDKRAEFDRGQGALSRRAGVIGLNGIYRIQVAFSTGKIKEQLRSFMAQNMSDIERTTRNQEIKIDNEKFTSRHIPLNKEFDKHLGMSGTLTQVFTKIFGSKGISSSNRSEPHLINGWESYLVKNDQILFRGLRHAITADKYEKDPEIRKKNSQEAAKELLKAALLQEIASQGLALSKAKEKGITLNLNSVSLVTPDDLRPLLRRLPGFHGQSDERQLLLDQVLALDSFKGTQIFELDGFKIPVQVNVNTFNFGVNAGATGIKKGPVTIRIGLKNQYVHNVKAMNGLRSQVNNFYTHVTHELLDTRNSQDLKPHIAQLQSALKNANQLMLDIELMLADKKAYLEGDNQYEIGAKILNLSNLMDQTIQSINKNNPDRKQISGFKCAFNCMSGKDRTGIMDAVAKAFAIMASFNNGIYPSHRELKTDPALRKLFGKILVKVLLEGGSLEITEINTGAKGYKVGKEARLLGMPLEQFLQVQGLSATTSS